MNNTTILKDRAEAKPIRELYNYWCNEIEPIDNSYRDWLEKVSNEESEQGNLLNMIMGYAENERKRCFSGGFKMALSMLQEGYIEGYIE